MYWMSCCCFRMTWFRLVQSAESSLITVHYIWPGEKGTKHISHISYYIHGLAQHCLVQCSMYTVDVHKSTHVQIDEWCILMDHPRLKNLPDFPGRWANSPGKREKRRATKSPHPSGEGLLPAGLLAAPGRQIGDAPTLHMSRTARVTAPIMNGHMAHLRHIPIHTTILRQIPGIHHRPMVIHHRPMVTHRQPMDTIHQDMAIHRPMDIRLRAMAILLLGQAMMPFPHQEQGVVEVALQLCQRYPAMLCPVWISEFPSKSMWGIYRGIYLGNIWKHDETCVFSFCPQANPR